MGRPKKEPIVHLDLLGKPIYLGNKVAVAHKNSMRICSVEKILPKSIRAVPVNGRDSWRKDILTTPNRVIVVNNEDVLAFILKGQEG
jgi:hypothetical protein